MMRIVRFGKEGRIGFGQLEGNQIIPFAGEPWNSETTGEKLPLDSVEILAPLHSPRIFAVGFNYAQHTAESGRAQPTLPALFMKPGTTVIGHDEPIIYPLGSTIVHYEGELAVIIGKQGRRIREDQAIDHVLGYCCANDVSERTIQREEMKAGCMLVGKSFDTFCPLGPWIETEIDTGNARLSTRLNGEVRQSTALADMIFPIPRLIAWLSSAITLLPGDVILSGSPAGVGEIKPGDEIEVEVSGLGILRNTVIAEVEGEPGEPR